MGSRKLKDKNTQNKEYSIQWNLKNTTKVTKLGERKVGEEVRERNPGKGQVNNNFSDHIICSRSHPYKYLVLCWYTSLTRSDSPGWQRFWAGYLPTSGARIDPQDVQALQTPAGGLVPSGQCLGLKDKRMFPRNEVYSKVTSWGKMLQLQKSLLQMFKLAMNL